MAETKRDLKTYLPRSAAEGLVIAGNLLPLVGYLFFDWSVLEILLFYVAEIAVMEILSFVVIAAFAFHDPPGIGSALFMTLGAYLIRLTLAGIMLLFLTAIAFAVAIPESEQINVHIREALVDFAREEYVWLIVLVWESLLSQYLGVIRPRTYRKIFFLDYLKSSFLGLFARFGATILVAWAFPRIPHAPVAMLIGIIIVKSVVEIWLGRRKRKDEPSRPSLPVDGASA